jgi:mono/diheme cytochrome c family protein
MRFYSFSRVVLGSCLFGLILFLTGCKKSGSEGPVISSQVEKGKLVYQTVCIACHNQNPKLDGALGPSVADASLELLEARIVRGGYPAQYKPKRETKQMVPLPQLKNEVPAIYEYLQSVK